MTGAERHLNEYPRDAQVLSILLGAFGLYAFSGRADHDAAKLAICERHARHYGEDWWFLSYLGWSHTEAGNLSHRPDICPNAPWRCEPKTPTPRMALARDVRARRHGSGPQISCAMAACA